MFPKSVRYVHMFENTLTSSLLVAPSEPRRENTDTKIAAIIDIDGTITENHITHTYFKKNLHFICHYFLADIQWNSQHCFNNKTMYVVKTHTDM